MLIIFVETPRVKSEWVASILDYLDCGLSRFWILDFGFGLGNWLVVAQTLIRTWDLDFGLGNWFVYQTCSGPGIFDLDWGTGWPLPRPCSGSGAGIGFPKSEI